MDSEKEERALIPPVPCLPQAEMIKDARSALGPTHRRIARRLRTLLKVRNCYLNLVHVSIVLTRVTVPEIVRLSLNVRIVRALTTRVCVTRNCSNPHPSNQPSTVNAPSSLLVGTESRIALQTAQALINENIRKRVRLLFDSGSHKLFVMAKAAGNYGLEMVRKEWVTINTFGEKTKEAGLREVVQFDVMPLQANRSLRLEA